MAGSRSPLQDWFWALSVIGQLTVCALLFYNKHFRRLPAFTVYSVLNLCQAGFLFVLYARYGLDSSAAKWPAWTSEAITVLAGILATLQLFHLVLGAYRGVWALAWRLLVITFALALVASYATLDPTIKTPWIITTTDRGFHLALAAASVVCLLLVRYYSIPIDPVDKILLAGFCFFSCSDVLKNTLLQAFFTHFVYRFARSYYQRLFDFATLAPFIILQVVWAVALDKPAHAVDQRPVLLPVSTYRQFSPELNLRLRALNERLSQFWKVEAPRP